MHMYNPRDPDLLARARLARSLLAEFNGISADQRRRSALLAELLGHAGRDVWVEPPFHCDYGNNIQLGDRTFVNVNCVFLDAAPIEIGEDALLGPGIQLYTASHPVRAADRIVPDWKADSGEAPYRTQSAPIRIGSKVWLGGGTIVMPGVTIGDDVTIGAGSLVTKNVPSGVLAFGRPCRVQRKL